MEELIKNNPWKGLQSYQETDIIYGRDEEIKALYTRILYNTQTVVYGKSGIGKSSIINAGIIPRAKHDGMLPVAIRLAHTTKKEQTETTPYVEQIFNRIKEEVLKAGGELEEIVHHVVGHEETLWELLHRYRIWNGKGEERKRLIPLLLFDQFEEIFTLEISNKRIESFFSELADLLNEVKPTYLTPAEDNKTRVNDLPKENEKEKTRNVFSKIANRKRNSSPEYLEKSDFHIVITLREDFLSYLERYTAYIPVMKQNRFPLLPLNEEQAAKIITEPVKDLVQKDVAEVIIQRVTGRKDFKLDGIPEIEVDAALLSLYMEQLYERKGDDDNIISSELVQYSDDIIKKFYEDSIEDISQKSIEYLEDELITNANRRNNVARIDLLSGGVSEDDLDKLIEKKVLRQFSYGGDLRIEFIHDILCPIVNDRIEHRELLAKEREAERKKKEDDERRERERLQQEEKLRKAEDEKQILLRKQQLQEEENRLLKRKQEEELARAERARQLQQEQLARAEEERKLLLRQQALQEEEKQMLLRKQEEERIQQEREKKELEEKAIAEKKAMEEKAQLIKRRNRRYLLVAAGIILLIVGYIVNDRRRYDWTFSEYYTQFETINGWPVGIGKALKDEDLLKTPLYYKLSYKGSKNKRIALDGRVLYTDVEVMSSNEHLPNSCRIPMMEWSDDEEYDSKAKQLNDILRKVVKIHYSSNEGNGIIGKEEWLGKDDKVLMAVNYFHQPNGGAWAQFYTPNGENMKIRDKGNDIDRLKLSWDPIGHIESVMYYDNKGVVREIENGNAICGYYWERQGNDTIIRYALNQFGLPTSGIPNNTMMTVCHGEKTETIYLQSSKIGDSYKHEIGCEEGFARMVSYGCPVDSICYYEPDKTLVSSVKNIERDGHGNVIRLCTKGENLFGFPPILRYEYQKGLVTKEERLNENKTPYGKDKALYKWEYAYDEKGFLSEEKRTDVQNKLAYRYIISKDIKKNDTIVITSVMDIRRNPIYVTQVDTIKGGRTSTTFYANNLNTRLNSYVVIGNDSLKVHRVITQKDGNTITKEFYTLDSLTVVPSQTIYDANHIYVKSYFKRIEEYDNAGNMLSFRLEEPNGTIIKSMMYIIQNGQVIGRAVKGIEGKPVRCDKWEEDAFLYYKLYYNKDFENQFCGVTSVDEWEHRSTTFDGQDYLFFKPFNFGGKWVDVFPCDNSGRKVEGKLLAGTKVYKDFEQFLYTDDPELSTFSIPYIHVLSSKCSMYNKNNPDKSVFDGDRIIEFNKWKVGDPESLLKKEWNHSMANKALIKLVVLRPNLEAQSLSRISLSFKTISDERKLVEYHFSSMSNEEKAFIQNWIK